MENYYDHMFYVPILHLKCKDWDMKQKKLLEHIETNSEKIKYYENDNIFTDYFHNPKESNKFFEELFDDELIYFIEKINYSTKEIHSSWIEISELTNYHRVHNHGAYGYSAVCFIKFDRNEHESTSFISPFLSFTDGNPLIYNPEVEEGSIIFFPSSINHYTNPNTSEKKRMILSFNIRNPNGK